MAKIIERQQGKCQFVTDKFIVISTGSRFRMIPIDRILEINFMSNAFSKKRYVFDGKIKSLVRRYIKLKLRL